MVGNGSDEIILNLLLCYGGEGCKVLYPYPTFEVYGIISKMLGIKTEEIFLDENFQIDPEKFINQGKGNIIFISYPNNPTGNHFNREDIKRIIEENSSLVVVDEAYYGFTRESFLNELNNYKNLLILRTFSKMFSLASLRIGFLFGDPDIVSNIMKVKLPYNVNSFSQMMARIILSKEEHFIERAKEIIKERERMYKALEKIEKITPYSSQANFILFRVEDNHCDYVFESLKKEKILVRCFKNIPPISDCLRVSIGSREENIKFINCLEDIISKV
jgi:histidinol-phosphate aminotransferase